MIDFFTPVDVVENQTLSGTTFGAAFICKVLGTAASFPLALVLSLSFQILERHDCTILIPTDKGDSAVREKVLSVTIKDCDVQTKRGSGAGGQNRNKRDTAVRIVHRASGAVGESQEERSQLQNKRTAFRRMAESLKFKV